MKMINTAALTVGIVLLGAAATGIVVKHLSSGVKDSYFDPDTDKLRNLPANLVVVRPTRFPDNSAKTRVVPDSEGKPAERMLGRNVPLKSVIGEAWDCNAARVVLPSDAPKGGYDFLITTGADARAKLQAALRKELGYTAHSEMRDTQVWILKVTNPILPGLTLSPDNEKAKVFENDGKLAFKHQRLSVLLGGLSQGLNQPVVDKTGLDNFYNFSVPWTPEVQKHMQKGTFDLQGVKKFLASLGLGLEQSNSIDGDVCGGKTMKSSKSQASKLQKNFKLQSPNTRERMFGVWIFSGAWSLDAWSFSNGCQVKAILTSFSHSPTEDL